MNDNVNRKELECLIDHINYLKDQNSEKDRLIRALIANIKPLKTKIEDVDKKLEPLNFALQEVATESSGLKNIDIIKLAYTDKNNTINFLKDQIVRLQDKQKDLLNKKGSFELDRKYLEERFNSLELKNDSLVNYFHHFNYHEFNLDVERKIKDCLRPNLELSERCFVESNYVRIKFDKLLNLFDEYTPLQMRDQLEALCENLADAKNIIDLINKDLLKYKSSLKDEQDLNNRIITELKRMELRYEKEKIKREDAWNRLQEYKERCETLSDAFDAINSITPDKKLIISEIEDLKSRIIDLKQSVRSLETQKKLIADSLDIENKCKVTSEIRTALRKYGLSKKRSLAILEQLSSFDFDDEDIDIIRECAAGVRF